MTSNSTDCQPGEIVDITIKGARVVIDSHPHVTVEDEDGYRYPVSPKAEITRCAPAEWPPQPGDLWRDRNGGRWFVVLEPGHTEPHMVNGMHFLAPSNFIKGLYGPLTLVHREDAR